LSIGTLIGALIAAPVSDKFGRKYSIVFWNLIFCVGVIVQITTITKWYQIAIGRWVAGLGVGGLSVLTPMYQSETAPRYVRGALVSCYQLFITLGIFVAYCINFGTEAEGTSRAWKLPIGIGFIWSGLMVFGILFMQESPRWEYRRGKVDSARHTIALSYGVSEDHPEVVREIGEIQRKLEAEQAGGAHHPWYEIFTGPRMGYRVLLGITLQALQQLTGANYCEQFLVQLVGVRHTDFMQTSTTEPRSSTPSASPTPTLPLSFSEQSTSAPPSQGCTLSRSSEDARP
jgi:SP family sugar:H+ symporter-like MFS transporter